MKTVGDQARRVLATESAFVPVAITAMRELRASYPSQNGQVWIVDP